MLVICLAKMLIYSVSITITDQLDTYRTPDNILFFIWANAIGPQYIPLRPIYEKLDGNPHRDTLMASLYNWLYGFLHTFIRC